MLQYLTMRLTLCCLVLRMKKIMIGAFLLFVLKTSGQSYSKEQYAEDFSFFWKTLSDNYCYFSKKLINWDELQPIYQAQVDTVSTKSGFLSTLERAFYELYDHHCSLRSNTRQSRRLVPTGTDIWAEFQNGKPVVVEVRKGFGCEKVGIRAGMEIVAVNDVLIENGILPYLGHTINIESKSFALRLLLAGDHYTKRKITVRSGNHMVDYLPDEEGLGLEHVQYASEIESKKIGTIGYIKINNYLFDNDIIPKFDSALNKMLDTRCLIIDLRETPSGGNTSVARAILGRFIKKEQFYQKHELWMEEKVTGIKRSWEEIVSPRGEPYTKPVVVLADHWTGSIAEGITIAFDGMKRATIMGTRLARLNGAVDGSEMPNTKIGFNFPTERLYHINGRPREEYEPTILIDVRNQTPGKDLILEAGIDYLKRKIK